ncbi:uncharacterized protein LOC121363788 isoform X1 [Pyrgilauda ruficollis]|uniref:uncharacterized protein LOC121363788 isoform X1 n=1 Tax=Pyrgilauda ruficollis TaxID=221976 RepID=UPI001B87A7E8|nr:uncharacterized protein LOC121363788 isoform X1 [Pyrgilauda ruficollis]
MGWTLIRVVPDALVSPHSDVLHKPPLSLRPTPPPCRRRVAPRRSHSCLCRVCDPCRRPLPVPRRTALPGCRLVRPRCSRLPQMPGLQHDRVLRCSPLARLLTRSAGDRTADWSRGAGGFGSTGLPQVHWTAVLTKECLKMMCTLSIPGATLSEIRLCGLLDSNTDVTVLSLAAWTLDWPLNPVETPVTGLGGTAQCYVSQWPVLVANSEGQTALIRPHVTSTPAYLWGRDVLSAWRVHIGTGF